MDCLSRLSAGGRQARAIVSGMHWGSALRLLWILMLVVHLPGLWRHVRVIACGQADWECAAAFGWLLLSALFFVLKAWGCPILRFRTDLRTVLVLTVAIVLLHASPLQLRVDAGANDLSAAALLLVLGLERVQEVLGRLLSTLRSSGAEQLKLSARRYVLISCRAPNGPARRCRGPRAPPGHVL